MLRTKFNNYFQVHIIYLDFEFLIGGTFDLLSSKLLFTYFFLQQQIGASNKLGPIVSGWELGFPFVKDKIYVYTVISSSCCGTKLILS